MRWTLRRHSDEEYDDPERVERFYRESKPEKFGGACFMKDRKSKPYMARVQVNGHQRHVGYFNSAEECYAANIAFYEANSYEKAAKIPEAWKNLSNKSHNNIMAKYGAAK